MRAAGASQPYAEPVRAFAPLMEHVIDADGLVRLISSPNLLHDGLVASTSFDGLSNETKSRNQ